MPFQRILIAVDGSPGGEAATRLGGELAAGTAAEVFLVHAVPLPSIVIGVDQAISDESIAYLEKTAQQAVDDAGALLDGFNVSYKRVIRPGGAANVILDVAEENEVDLIVVGHRGLGAMKRFILGSVSANLAHHASCAVLIAPVAKGS